jgi:hypothetical protein
MQLGPHSRSFTPLVVEDRAQDPATGSEILYRTAFIIEVLITAESIAALRNTQGRLRRRAGEEGVEQNCQCVEGLGLQGVDQDSAKKSPATRARRHTPRTNQSRVFTMVA